MVWSWNTYLLNFLRKHLRNDQCYFVQNQWSKRGGSPLDLGNLGKLPEKILAVCSLLRTFLQVTTPVIPALCTHWSLYSFKSLHGTHRNHISILQMRNWDPELLSKSLRLNVTQVISGSARNWTQVVGTSLQPSLPLVPENKTIKWFFSPHQEELGLELLGQVWAEEHRKCWHDASLNKGDLTELERCAVGYREGTKVCVCGGGEGVHKT